MTRDVLIQPVLNGFVCHIGCQKVVFESRESLIENLRQYYACPDGVEALFTKMAINPMPTPVCPPPPATEPFRVQFPSGAGNVCSSPTSDPTCGGSQPR